MRHSRSQSYEEQIARESIGVEKCDLIWKERNGCGEDAGSFGIEKGVDRKMDEK